jgi:hypothetical protein
MKYDNVEIDKIKGVMYKDHLLINYRNERLNIQTDWILLNNYGIPKADKYHTTEESRRYLQIPLFPDDTFYKFIQSLDNHFSSDCFKKQFLQEKQQNFNYISIIKEGKNDYPPFMKIKIDFYNDKYLSEIYHKDDKDNIKCDLNCMNDIKRCIPYKSDIKIIFRINKLWFMSKNYGVQIKLVKVLIKNQQNKIENIDFL